MRNKLTQTGNSLPDQTSIEVAALLQERLADVIAFNGELTRNGIEQANRFNDADTTDIFSEVSRGADNNVWFLERPVSRRSGAVK